MNAKDLKDIAEKIRANNNELKLKSAASRAFLIIEAYALPEANNGKFSTWVDSDTFYLDEYLQLELEKLSYKTTSYPSGWILEWD